MTSLELIDEKSSILKSNKQSLDDKRPKKISSVIGIGDPIVDILSAIDKSTIERYGLKWGQTIFVNDENKGIFNELESHQEVTYIPGGSVQNTLRVTSWCLNNKERSTDKIKVSMLGCVGSDIYKDKIIEALASANVNSSLLEISPAHATSRCGVGIYKKERCLITELCASKDLSEEFIRQNLENIKNHDAFLIEGYIVPNKMKICEEICQSFNKHKKLVILTISAVFIINNYYEDIMKIANMSDIIVGNMEEAEALAGEKFTNVEAMCQNIHKKFESKSRLLIITAGKLGAYCSKYDYDCNRLEFFYCPTKQLKDEEIMDTNGAGDAFLGGFVAEYMKGSTIPKCCENGNRIASVILKNVGCTF